ncbi:MAG: calcium-binding protein [Blastocatellia bacterium]
MGFKDPDTGEALGGWQGRITEIEEDDDEAMITVTWDSVTLRATPVETIARCEEEGLSWQDYIFGVDHLTPASARDTLHDVELATAELLKSSRWLDLGEEGARIRAVLADVDDDDELEAIEAWENHFNEVLTFPIAAEVSEFQERGPLRTDDKVSIKNIVESDDLYGVLVTIYRGGEKFVFPLCDLEVTDQNSPNYQPIKDYAVWFANR